MKKIFLLNLFCFLSIVCPLRASALPGVDFDVTGAMSAAYDDNVTLVNRDEKSDFVTNLSAGLGAQREGDTYDFSVDGNIAQHVFAEYSSFNNNSQDINIDFQKELSSQDRFSVGNTFEHAEDSTSFEDDFGRASGRYSYYRNIFDAQYTRDVSKYIAVQGYYGNENYSASREDVKSSLLNRIGFDVDYIKSSATTFLVGYDFTARHIDDGGNATVHTYSTGGRHFLTKQLYLDSRVGVSFVESFDGGGTSEPSVMVALINDFTETDSAGLSYRKTSVPSAFAADIFDSWRVALDLNRQLLERLKMTGSLFWGEGDFTAQGITDRQVGVSSRLSYDVSRNTRTFFAHTYSKIDSNIDTRSYARNWVEVGVGVAF